MKKKNNEIRITITTQTLKYIHSNTYIHHAYLNKMLIAGKKKRKRKIKQLYNTIECIFASNILLIIIIIIQKM